MEVQPQAHQQQHAIQLPVAGRIEPRQREEFIGQQIDRPLHRIGDSEVGVFALGKELDEQDAATETDHLDNRLNDGKAAHDAGTM